MIDSRRVRERERERERRKELSFSGATMCIVPNFRWGRSAIEGGREGDEAIVRRLGRLHHLQISLGKELSSSTGGGGGGGGAQNLLRSDRDEADASDDDDDLVARERQGKVALPRPPLPAWRAD